MKLFSFTCSSKNYGTVTASVLAENYQQAVLLAVEQDARFADFRFNERECDAVIGAVLLSENNE